MVTGEPGTTSLHHALKAARDQGWSGQVAVSVDGTEVGSVVMRGGRVAWSVCVEQAEDLGTFLWRLGRVTREELAEVRRRYDAHGGRRKLGTLMEEEGILPRAVLRRCLLLHTRRALARLLAYPETLVSAERTAFRVDEAMTFTLEEVVPSAGQPDAARSGSEPNLAARWGSWGEENKALAEFATIPGYLAVGLLTRDGEVLAAHAARDVDPATLGVFVVSVLEFSDLSTHSAGLGSPSAVCFECARGTLVAQWLESSRTHVALVLIGPEGNTGMARYRLGAAADSLSLWGKKLGPSLRTHPAIGLHRAAS